MSRRILTTVVVWILAGASAWAQPHDPGAGDGQLPTHRVSGVIVSQSGRIAFVNGELHREGDIVDGAKILAIEPGTVHMAFKSREYTLYVGAKSARIRASSSPGLLDPIASERSATVNRGETLSGIAERYLTVGITRHQTMIALYEANPQAFNGNINRLRADAVLRIPDPGARRHLAADVATAEVLRQTDAWRTGHESAVSLARAPDRESYGPVRSGETLSGIAERVLPAGITRHQTMIALYDANPQAFGGNINLLYEGSVLRIPETSAWCRQAPDAATVEVLRQTDEWHKGSALRAHATAPPPTPILALTRNRDRL